MAKKINLSKINRREGRMGRIETKGPESVARNRASLERWKRSRQTVKTGQITDPVTGQIRFETEEEKAARQGLFTGGMSYRNNQKYAKGGMINRPTAEQPGGPDLSQLGKLLNQKAENPRQQMERIRQQPQAQAAQQLQQAAKQPAQLQQVVQQQAQAAQQQAQQQAAQQQAAQQQAIGPQQQEAQMRAQMYQTQPAQEQQPKPAEQPPQMAQQPAQQSEESEEEKKRKLQAQQMA